MPFLATGSRTSESVTSSSTSESWYHVEEHYELTDSDFNVYGSTVRSCYMRNNYTPPTNNYSSASATVNGFEIVSQSCTGESRATLYVYENASNSAITISVSIPATLLLENTIHVDVVYNYRVVYNASTISTYYKTDFYPIIKCNYQDFIPE